MSDVNNPKSAAPQRLPALELVTCAACGQRVSFRFRSSRDLDATWRLVYLRCPACGASATQMQEREHLAPVNRPRVKFKYIPLH